MRTPSLVRLLFFFFNHTATTEIYTLSLHDALPILCTPELGRRHQLHGARDLLRGLDGTDPPLDVAECRHRALRSEEHTSELQSHSDLVCRLLLEKKKHNTN